MNNNIKNLKSIVNKTIKEKIKNNETTVIQFDTRRHEDDRFGGEGHIQYNTTLSRASWDVFYNAKCIYTSYTLISAITKLDRLDVFENNLKLNN